jgi:type IV secretory pathway TraG/TraD family ATPase VirD4
MTKPYEKKESLLLKLVGGVFFSIPLGISRGILVVVLKIQDPGLRYVIFGLLTLSSIAFVLALDHLLNLLNVLVKNNSGSWVWPGGIRYSVFYLIYMVVTLPLFLVAAYFSRDARLFKPDCVKKEPDSIKMRWDRLKSNYHRVYIGESLDRNKPLYLTNEQRLMHCEVVGSTGTGKTESVLLTMFAHDIANGKGAIIVDGKGDLELFHRIFYIVSKKKRRSDFFFFSLAHPEKSNTYNPLYHGNPTELKDKLINSMAWSEEFYRRMAEQAALTLFNAIASKRNTVVRFKDLHSYLTDEMALGRLADEAKDPNLEADIKRMVKGFKDNQKFLSGLIADLYLTSRSGFSNLLNVRNPQIDLLRVYEKNQICYFALDLQKYTDTSRRLGRMIIQDIRAVSSHIQSTMTAHKRHFFPVFIDDASSFLELNFIDFLNKCRASGFAVTMLHQSLGDLVFRGAPNFQQQVIENTNIKIVLRQDDPLSVEKFAKIAGTRRTIIPTYQTEEKILGKGFTGTGSVREGQTFRIEPDLIRGLKRGEAVVIWKSPSLLTENVKLDFFGHTRYPGDYAPEPPPEEDVEPSDHPLRVIDDIKKAKKLHS